MSTRALLLLAFSYLLVLSLVAFGVPLGVNLARRTDREIRAKARSQADVVAVGAAALLRPAQAPGLRRMVAASAPPIRGRVVVVDTRGRVIADSATALSLGAVYLGPQRPEIGQALAGRALQERRRSRTLGRELLVTTAPVRDAQGRVRGAVRVTQSVSAVAHAVRRNVVGLLAVGLLVLLVGLGAATLLARRLARPVLTLAAAADRVAAGDLTTAVPVAGAREHRALATAFNTMTARVSRNLQAQQEFVADASHQLRTPLTGLRLRLEEAAAESPGPAASAHLEAATAELDRFSHTIDELLVLSRGAEPDAPASSVDLAETARAAVARWQTAATARGHRLSLRVAAPGRAWCARGDLDRALDGVLENAVRYTPEGGTLEVVAGPGGIDVCDSGPGIPDDELDVVLERFRRGRGGRAAGPGTGLGLTISRELTRRWGGELTLERREPTGLKVRLRLPPELSKALPGEA